MLSESSPLRVLGFDSWTVGSHHFERLVSALSGGGARLQLVHLGSWGNDAGRPNRERIGSLETCDIASYSNSSFEHILDVEKPDAVIFLSIETFAHRAFIRYCRQRGIPTLLLYHGLVNVQVTNDRRGSYRVSPLAYAQFVWSRLGKLLRRTFPCYIRSLVKTGGTWADWRQFVSDIARMATGKTALRGPARDAKTTRCAVYTDSDTEHAVRIYGFAADEISVVGNPDLARFGLREDMLGSHLQRDTPRTREIMYLDTGLPALRLLFASHEAYIEHLLYTASVLRDQGYSLLLKPHPAHDLEFLQSRLQPAGISLISNAEFLSRLCNCDVCIAETTTLAMVPALLGMPLLLANYGPLAELRFGRVLTSYPRSHALRSLAGISQLLAEDERSVNVAAVHDWISRNTGPLPAEQMPTRVAQIIISMIGNSRSEVRTATATATASVKA